MLRTLFAGVALIFALAAPAAIAQEREQLVKLVPVRFSEDSVTRQYFGRVVAKETVDLAFSVGGQIVQFPVVEGERISKGSLLAQLDLYQFQLAVEEAELRREQADRNVQRLEKLAGRVASQVTVDDAKTDARLADVALRNALDNLSDATLKAPFDALVVARDVPIFTSVSAGTPVVRLHDMSELRIEIDVPEVVFQRAGNDPDIDVWARFPSSEEAYPVEFREFNAQTSEVGQTFKITLGMQPPEELAVFPGSSATVFATLNSVEAKAEVPGASIVTSNDGSTSVMLFSPGQGHDSGTVTQVPVTVEPSERGAVRILTGLENGQEIVASGAARLDDGQRVRRFTGFSN